MKVVLFCNYPFTKVYSGSNLYNERLATALAAIGEIDLPDTQTLDTVPPGSTPYIMSPVHFLRMRALLLEIKPEVAHALSTELLYSTLAGLGLPRYPTMLTVYGIAAEETKYFKLEYTKLRQHVYRLLPYLLAVNRTQIRTDLKAHRSRIQGNYDA